MNRVQLDHYRRLFLARYPDFEHFGQTTGRYYNEERAYKDRLIFLTREAVGANLRDQDLGGRLLDILVGRAGAPSGLLGWRTDGRIEDLRKSHPKVLEGAAARLARAEDVSHSIAAFVSDTWPTLVDGQLRQPYSESQSLPSMLAALAHPDEAYGINTRPVKQAAEALIKRPLLGANPMCESEYRAVFGMAEEVRRIMATEWHWAPRDFWDVQGFIWAIKRTD